MAAAASTPHTDGPPGAVSSVPEGSAVVPSLSLPSPLDAGPVGLGLVPVLVVLPLVVLPSVFPVGLTLEPPLLVWSVSPAVPPDEGLPVDVDELPPVFPEPAPPALVFPAPELSLIDGAAVGLPALVLPVSVAGLPDEPFFSLPQALTSKPKVSAPIRGDAAWLHCARLL